MDELKYKVGDKVIVNIDASKRSIYKVTPVSQMIELNGKVVTIDTLYETPFSYGILGYNYTEDMLLPFNLDTVKSLLNKLLIKVFGKETSASIYTTVEGYQSISLHSAAANKALFDKLNVSNKMDFVSNIVGYIPYNITYFPAVKSLEDLYKVLVEMYKLADKKIASFSKHTIRETEELANKIGRELLDSNAIFIVTQKSGTFSVNYSTNETNKIFELILLENIDDFLKQVVGYNPSRGSHFPEFNYLEDLYKVLEAILARWDHIVEHKRIMDSFHETESISGKEKAIDVIRTIVNKILRKLTPDETIIGTVDSFKDRFIISIIGEHNSFIFEKLNIQDPKAYIENIVGYTPKGGDFPPVKTLGDLYKVVCDLDKRTEEFLNENIEISSEMFLDSSLTPAISGACMLNCNVDDVPFEEDSSKEGFTIKYPSNKNKVVRLNFKY